MPNFTEDYDAIGFDIDNCLVKYNIKAITRALVECDLRDLHENAGWPKEIMDFNLDDSETSDLFACLIYSCLDTDKGIILKLGEDREVLSAFKGRKKLSKEEI